LEGIYPLRHIARKTKVHFYITEKKGLPFVFSRLKRRKALVAGACLFMFALYLLSSFIWTVEVTGNVAVKKGELLSAANEAGLGRGSLKWYVSIEKTEEYILEEFDAISWVGVDIKGTHATIEIAEKKLPPVEPTGPSNIIAKKTGLIKEILVLSGQPVVEEGDTVGRGQILISGELLPPEQPDQEEPDMVENEPSEDITVDPVFVRARGIVRARIWYEGYGEEVLVEEGFRKSGKSIDRVCIKLGGKEIILKGPETIPFDRYELQSKVKTLPSWRNLSVPVELNTEKYLEMVPFKNVRSMKEAKESAAQKALEDAKETIPQKATVLHNRIENVTARHKENIVRIKVTVETLEDIGSEKPFNPKKEAKIDIDGR
ncbi:MAG TPA: sporulation protein YqfD, partial [Clostridia bacterium]|nr:sporulation protein YqfD [Clostridia bacterium]